MQNPTLFSGVVTSRRRESSHKLPQFTRNDRPRRQLGDAPRTASTGMTHKDDRELEEASAVSSRRACAPSWRWEISAIDTAVWHALSLRRVWVQRAITNKLLTRRRLKVDRTDDVSCWLRLPVEWREAELRRLAFPKREPGNEEPQQTDALRHDRRGPFPDRGLSIRPQHPRPRPQREGDHANSANNTAVNSLTRVLVAHHPTFSSGDGSIGKNTALTQRRRAAKRKGRWMSVLVRDCAFSSLRLCVFARGDFACCR